MCVCVCVCVKWPCDSADPDGMIPEPGASAAEYVAWFQRMRMSLPALANLAPYVDDTCEATLRADPTLARLFAELDNKRYAPGYLEKPLIKNFRELTMRGPAEVADVSRRGAVLYIHLIGHQQLEHVFTSVNPP